MPAKPEKPSRAAVALGKILAEDGPLARALKDNFHRTMLWKYKMGLRRPGLEGAQKMRKLTRGRIKESCWHERVSG